MKTLRNWPAAALRMLPVLALGIGLAGCVGALFAPKLSVPEQMKPGADAPKLRALQTRRFDGVSEPTLQAASISVLQDMGFQITVSDAQLGLIIGRKGREADKVFADIFLDMPEVIGKITLWELSLGYFPGPPDPKTKMTNGFIVALLIEPELERNAPWPHVRITFYRYGLQPSVKQENEIGWAEPINNPVLYEKFFAMLSKEIALKAQR
jgi:hypothetical protein